ncbi:MAG TPA: DNA-processing protein DprA [Planctomycetota bacterium]
MLALAEGFGESPVAALLAPDVDPAAFLREPPCPPDVPPRVAVRLRDPGLASRAASVRQAASRHGLHLLTPAHEAWPRQFQTAPLRPLVLFARGDLAALSRTPSVAVVGSRTPTPYGHDAATRLCAALAQSGTVLWSGLARGIDGIAHEACVTTGVPTVAVLAGGLDEIYPPEHGTLGSRIEATGGCLLGELPPGRRARRGHFPRRNRLLAVGADAVVVVEASLSSGALHTARFAAECGTEVFALPGPWASERSQGCHRLIAEGAILIEGPDALLRSLGIQPTQTGPASLHLARCADEQAILAGLRQGPRPTDLLQRECGLDRAAFLRALFGLQGRNVVSRLPGDLWRLHAPPPATSR